jgi:predicted GNAT family N-acyltransferase
MLTITVCATATERDTALALRHAVFIIEQGVPKSIERDEYDATATHFLAMQDGEAVGVARLVDKGEGIGKIGRVAVLPAHRNRGIGAALMRFVVETAQMQGFREVFLDAQLPAYDFYLRLGFVPEGEVFEEASILHRRMRSVCRAG